MRKLTSLPELNIAFFSFLLNFAWEVLQTPFFQGKSTETNTIVRQLGLISILVSIRRCAPTQPAFIRKLNSPVTNATRQSFNSFSSGVHGESVNSMNSALLAQRRTSQGYRVKSLPNVLSFAALIRFIRHFLLPLWLVTVAVHSFHHLFFKLPMTLFIQEHRGRARQCGS